MGSHGPESPADLGKPSLLSVLKRVRARFKADNVTDLAAALTYYAVLAVVPGLIVLLSIFGLTGASTHQLTTQFNNVAPGSTAKIVQTMVQQAQSHQSGAGLAAILGLAVALWSASGYVGAFMRASNTVYDIDEGRPIWKTASTRVGVTVFAVLMLVAIAAIVVVTGSVARSVGDTIGVGSTAVQVWDIAKWPILLLLISVLLAVLFWAAPNAKQAGIKWISPGGVLATLVWLAVSGLFAVYVATFSSYGDTYGPLAGIVVFLIWMWLSNIALLFGLEVNAELERERMIAQGLPEDVEPFAEPRDTRKLTVEDRRAAERSAEARRPNS